MSKRVRITQRTRKSADGSVPYPGNVNQPDRTDPAWDQYHTFEQQINHELPDMRHEWKDDERDDIGFGIQESVKNPGEAPIGEAKPIPAAPTMASVRVAANKAVKLAVLLLGEKVPEKVIEQQARDFLHIGSEAMDRTLARFANTSKFYADDEEDVTSSKALAEKNSTVPPAIATPANPQEADKAAAVKKADDEKVAAVAPKKAEDEKKVEDKKEEKKDEEKVAAAAPKKAEEAPAPAPVPVPEEKEAKSKKAEEAAPVVPPPAPVEEEKEAAKKVSSTDMDIELQGADEEMAPDPQADAMLASLFKADEIPSTEEEQAEVVEAKAKTAKKAGVTRLGGQPKVASESAEPTDLSSLWASAPDVNELFK